MSVRWTRRGSGDDRITLHVAFHLSVGDLADILAWHEELYGSDPGALTGQQVREAVRETLHGEGARALADVGHTLVHLDAARRGYGGPDGVTGTRGLGAGTAAVAGGAR